MAPTTTTTPTTSPTQVLLLDHHSIPPGGPVTASGTGCSANSPVQLSIDSTPVGSTVAGRDGSFSTPLSVSVPVGQFTVVAVCGPTLETTLDVVLTSHASPPSSTAALLLVILLFLIGLARWQLVRR